MESAGLREINMARRYNGKSYIPTEYVLWCQDHGWVELYRGPFEIIDWRYFRVTSAGYAAAGVAVPPWVERDAA